MNEKFKDYILLFNLLLLALVLVGGSTHTHEEQFRAVRNNIWTQQKQAIKDIKWQLEFQHLKELGCYER